MSITPEGFQPIAGYRLTVYRGQRAGLVRTYRPNRRGLACSVADRMDREYGAICSSVQPIYEPTTCTQHRDTGRGVCADCGVAL